MIILIRLAGMKEQDRIQDLINLFMPLFETCGIVECSGV